MVPPLAAGYLGQRAIRPFTKLEGRRRGFLTLRQAGAHLSREVSNRIPPVRTVTWKDDRAMEIATGYEAALRAQISSMEDQRSKLLSELARLDGHIEGLHEALALYLDESRLRCISAASDPREARTPDPESAWAHIMEMLESAAPSEVSVDAMDSFLARNGFGVARATLRTNLSKAVDDGIIERVRWGYYRKAQIQNGQAEAYVHHLPGVEADNADRG